VSLATVEVEAIGAEAAVACRRLSAAAGWAHEPADWRARLSLARGFGVRLGTRLAACGLLFPGHGDAAFLGMLLTEPEARGRGLAAAIVEAALDTCRREGRRAWLIAVPKAVPLYARLGFVEAGAVLNFRAAPPAAVPVPGVRRARPSDLPVILALDAAVWGPRAELVSEQAARFPGLAFVAEDGSGFALAADRAGTRTLGPVVAPDAARATALACAALAGAAQARCDSLAQHAAFHASLGLGTPTALPLMVHGAGAHRLPFADPSRLFAAQSAAAG
jgi:GNAT superfamily N-acetyltransferase